MENFFDAVVNGLTILVDWVTHFVTDGARILALLTIVDTVPTILSVYIWSPIGVCGLIIIGIGILKLFLGWGNT